jgi:hypothetical protein
MLVKCHNLPHNFLLMAQSSDTWQWQPDPVRGYSVCGDFQLLTSQQHTSMEVVEDLIWHKKVPLQVSMFFWTLLRGRLPTKVNLVCIIIPTAHSCVSGCGRVESSQHLFISCNIFGFLWSLVQAWIDFSSVDPQNLSDHFLQFTYSSGGLRARRSVLQLV